MQRQSVVGSGDEDEDRPTRKGSLPSTKKRKHADDEVDEDEDEDDSYSKRPTTRSRSKTASKALTQPKRKVPRSPSPGPSATTSALSFEKMASLGRDRRLSKYFAYTEGLMSEVEAKLEALRRSTQDIAHIEFRLGKREGRTAGGSADRRHSRLADRGSDEGAEGSEGK